MALVKGHVEFEVIDVPLGIRIGQEPSPSRKPPKRRRPITGSSKDLTVRRH